MSKTAEFLREEPRVLLELLLGKPRILKKKFFRDLGIGEE
jgi:hypothetical protein